MPLTFRNALPGDESGVVGAAKSGEGFVDLLRAWPRLCIDAKWGRMAIVDTKPFKLRVILHRIFVERPQVTGIPAWPGGAACYRRSRYIL